MKLTFSGDSLTEIHNQIIDAAATITLGKHTEGKKAENVMELRQVAEELIQQAPDTKPENVFSIPQQQGEDVTSIDGYNISDGQVWVPVEGRNSAYKGVPVDKYIADRDAKLSGAELDAAGTPYDPSIHTSTKAKTQKGLWKNRPGGGVAKATQVEEQPATSEESKPATVQEIVAHEDSGPAIGKAPSMHNYESFKTNLMTVVVKLINENKITRDYMKDLNSYFRVANLWDVKNDDEKCKQLFKLFLDYQFIMGA